MVPSFAVRTSIPWALTYSVCALFVILPLACTHTAALTRKVGDVGGGAFGAGLGVARSVASGWWEWALWPSSLSQDPRLESSRRQGAGPQ